MARTYILLVWIELLKGSFIEAGIPLISRSYSSWPSLRSYSKSVAPPFLTATPRLSVFPNLNVTPIIPSPDVDFIPKPEEITPKTSVILHKVHKNSDNEIILTLKLVKENDDDLTKENLKCNDNYLDEKISPDIEDDLLITPPEEDEIETENETDTENETETVNETETEDIPLETSMINEETPVEYNTLNENTKDCDEDATEDILTDDYE